MSYQNITQPIANETVLFKQIISGVGSSGNIIPVQRVTESHSQDEAATLRTNNKIALSGAAVCITVMNLQADLNCFNTDPSLGVLVSP